MADLMTDDVLGVDEDTGEGSPSFEDLLESTDKELEWLIPPEQFVDFWVAGMFILVGMWQVITILFLLTE